MKRRRFLGSVVAFFGTIAFGSFAYPLVRFLAPPRSVAETKKLTLLKAEVPLGGSRDIIVNGTPGIVINRSGKGLVAFSRICTHLGCLVQYDRENMRLVCPCHAGTFDLEGNVLGGPPPKALPKLPLRVEGENILIG